MTRTVLAIVASGVLFAGLTQHASADMDCADFSSHAAAQDYFEANGGSAFNNVDLLDEDRDGLACEWGPVSNAYNDEDRLERGRALAEMAEPSYDRPYDPEIDGPRAPIDRFFWRLGNAANPMVVFALIGASAAVIGLSYRLFEAIKGGD